MWMVVRIPCRDITNLHYNFVVAKPLVTIKLLTIDPSKDGTSKSQEMPFKHPEHKNLDMAKIVHISML